MSSVQLAVFLMEKENKAANIIKMLEECINDKSRAAEYFGNISFGRKVLTGRDLKKLADTFKRAYSQWIDVLSDIDDEVCKAWDQHLKQKEAIAFFAALSPEEKAAMGFAPVQQQLEDSVCEVNVVNAVGETLLQTVSSF